MIEKISLEGIFRAQAISCHKLLTKDSICYLVPSFQRRFSWDHNSINRLFDDLLEAIYLLPEDPQSLMFIGSVLFQEKKAENTDIRFYSVIDGQQRLSAIMLATSILHRELTKLDMQIEPLLVHEDAEPLKKFRERVAVNLIKRLRASFTGQFDQYGEGLENQFPKLVRENRDVISDKPGKQKYESPFAKYLFEYIDHIENGKAHQYVLYAHDDVADQMVFSDNYEVILGRVSEPGAIEQDIQCLAHGDAAKLLGNQSYCQPLFGDLELTLPVVKKALAHLGGKSEAGLSFIYLAAIASFFLDRVAVIRVVSTNDDHVFDIFEALNSTGEPLTALETLRPMVSEHEDTKNMAAGGYAGSLACIVFKKLDDYMDEFSDAQKKQRKSAELVVQLSLLVEGKKQSLHLTCQRRYLRNVYSAASTAKRKRDLVDVIGVLVDFNSRFWDKERIAEQLAEEKAKDKDSILVCLDFIRATNTTMAIPILTRFYDAYQSNKKNYREFASAVKATAAFLAIWRAAYGSTSQIDDAFRELMHGGKIVNSNKAHCLTEKVNRTVPSSQVLRQHYRALLKKKKIDSYKKWEEKVVKAQLGSKAKEVVKFLLLISSHNTSVKPSGLLEDCAPSVNKDYLRMYKWRDESMKTVEHIAPVTKPNEGWDDDIYAGELVQTIGNLTILPEKENGAFGNKGWINKRLLYIAFSSETHGERAAAIAAAEAAGYTISNSMKDSIRGGRALPAVKAIGRRATWTPQVIRNRSRNIAKLSWREFKMWLKPGG